LFRLVEELNTWCSGFGIGSAKGMGECYNDNDEVES